MAQYANNRGHAFIIQAKQRMENMYCYFNSYSFVGCLSVYLYIRLLACLLCLSICVFGNNLLESYVDNKHKG